MTYILLLKNIHYNLTYCSSEKAKQGENIHIIDTFCQNTIIQTTFSTSCNQDRRQNTIDYFGVYPHGSQGSGGVPTFPGFISMIALEKMSSLFSLR